jgi:hypothetical protein
MNRGQRRAQWRAQTRSAQPATPPPVTGIVHGASIVGPSHRTAPRSRSIQLRIGELELRGFQPAHARATADTLQRELVALLARRGLPPAWTRNANLRRAQAAAVPLAPGAAGETFERRLALAILDSRAGERG